MKKTIRHLPTLFLFSLVACGKSAAPTIAVSASLLNGITGASALTSSLNPLSGPYHLLSPSDGTWYLTPDTMTVTLKGISFSNGGDTSSDSSLNCDVKYDKTLPSLSAIADCPFQVAAGQYTSVSVTISNLVKFKVYDQTNGFYTTSASATNPITTTDPGAGEEVTLDANNCSSCPAGDNTSTYVTHFPSAVTVDSNTLLYVVLDPSQWLYVNVSGGTVGTTWEAMRSGVSLPVIASVSAVAKAELYNNSVSTGAGSTTIEGITNPLGMHIYFSDATTPARVDMRYGVGTQSGSICSTYNSAWPGNPLPFASSSDSEAFYGSAGWLGEDSSHVISFVVGYDSTGPDWSKIAAVFSIPDVAAAGGSVGDSVTLSYVCDTSGISTSYYPSGYQSSGAPNYSVGAPTLSSPSTLALKFQSN